MLFREKHIKQILNGEKTMTRRLPGKSANYQIGRVYTIRPCRFAKPAAQILIIRKFRQKLGEISTGDMKKEGYNSLDEFQAAWIKINGSWKPEQIVTCYEFKLVNKKREATF